MMLTGKRSLGYLWVDGDSYASAASSPSLGNSLNAALNRGYHGTGVGGDDLSTIAARILGAQYADLRSQCPLVLWDGSPNGYGSVSAYMAVLASIAAAVHRLIILPPVCRAAQTAQEQTDTKLIQAAIASAYPTTYVDVQAALIAGATSPGDDANVAAGQVPTSLLQGDLTHLTSGGMALAATPTVAKVAALGY